MNACDVKMGETYRLLYNKAKNTRGNTIKVLYPLDRGYFAIRYKNGMYDEYQACWFEPIEKDEKPS